MTVAAAAPTPDIQAALSTLASAFASPVDRAEIDAMVKEAVANVVFPTRTVIERANGETKELSGSTHHKLADVTTAILAGEHVLMVGPAGTGKSTIAEQAAEALGLKSYSISLSPQTPASQLLGYMQATGDYVRSLFREAYEHGGVFHFDEFDNGHPSVLAVINGALANGHMAFPDQMVKRHADFRAVASANTYGRGATRAYVGRQAIDAATLDRFSVETIEVDEALENELCHSTGLEVDQVERVLAYVRKLRRNAEERGMTVVVSPRASVGMCRLLAAGRSWESSIESRIRRGLGDTDWAKLIG
ncbi:AAA family ATPase [Saccharopolyspora pogona]|uniref:AAA family ATPase n=1 Tax=Saccharopolyspora pogona TaxID=333966 RepID=UPI001686C9D2|nr:AAA family ATPase [Saccharopolyspora pogona]